MKTILLFLLACIGCVGSSYAQFVSVKDGDWRSPQTWSTNPESTAIPDSTKDVVIQHNVYVTSQYEASSCKTLTVASGGTMSNHTSAWVGSNLDIKGDFVNYGTISPGDDYHGGFYLTVRGDFENHGFIKNYKPSKLSLSLHGNLINNGSFRKVTHLSFAGNGNVAHTHKIKSLNDSTIYMGDASFSDALGVLELDSFAIINTSTFDMKGSKLVMPASVSHENKVIFDNANLQNGIIEANNNKLYTKEGTELYFNNNYNSDNNMYVRNAQLVGNYAVGGDNDDAFLVLQGENILTGQIRDWYSTNIWSAGERVLKIEGSLISEGKIYNTPGTNRGLWIFQAPGSAFVNRNDSLKIQGMQFDGRCTFTNEKDTLDVLKWRGTDATTELVLTKSVWFDQTVNIDMKGGKIILNENEQFKSLWQWYNRIDNTRFEANGGEISFTAFQTNCTVDNAVLNTAFINDALLTGKTTVIGSFLSYGYQNVVITSLGDFENKGSVRNSGSGGSLYLHLKADVFSVGTEWANFETRLNGSKNQHLIVSGTSYITGKVFFDAVITGSSFQWQKNGIDIPNATASTLTFATGINASHFGVYHCIVDGTTNSRTIFVGAEIPPAFEIYEVLIKNISPTSALIHWKTSVPSSGFVFYAENDNSNGHPLEAMEPETLTTDHRIELTGLTSGATIYFVIDQSDAEWNNIRSEEFQFIAGDMSLGALKIKRIVDVPDDQGGWVHIHFESDMLDKAGDITMYGVWQWNDNDWVSVGHVPAMQKDDYAFLAHTYADSTATKLNWSKFYVTAHMANPLVYYTCEVDSGYSIDNLLPSVPTGLSGVRTQNGTELSWNVNPDPDVQYYMVFRNEELIGYSETNTFVDEAFITSNAGGIIRYAVAAVDFSGNKSQPSPSIQVVISSVGDLTFEGVKLSNTPNPFKEKTLITFVLNESSMVEVSILDLTGKLIQVLDKREFSTGTHKIEFFSTGMTAGVYLCRLKSDSGIFLHKMIVL